MSAKASSDYLRRMAMLYEDRIHPDAADMLDLAADTIDKLRAMLRAAGVRDELIP